MSYDIISHGLIFCELAYGYNRLRGDIFSFLELMGHFFVSYMQL